MIKSSDKVTAKVTAVVTAKVTAENPCTAREVTAVTAKRELSFLFFRQETHQGIHYQWVTDCF
jgi:hypothetical protein